LLFGVLCLRLGASLPLSVESPEAEREEDEEAPRERIVVTRAADPLEVSAQFLAEVAERAPSPAERAVLARAYEAVLASRGGE